MAFRPLVLVGLATLIAACAMPPEALRGSFSDLNVAEGRVKDGHDVPVRWGGRIASVENRQEQTCFQVVSVPLDTRARPRDTDETDGRFIACVTHFYDPAVYSPGREITVTGTLEGTRAGKVGQMTYDFPFVRADTVFLWPKRPRREIVYYAPAFGYGFGAGPFWGGWGPWWPYSTW
jgi:outer membrane lipoprotein